MEEQKIMEEEKNFLCGEIADYFKIHMTAGNKLLKLYNKAVLYHFQNGMCGFSGNNNIIEDKKYYIINYEWRGAKYYRETINKGHATGVGLIGTGVLGSGGSRNKNIQKNVEENTIAFMELQSVQDGEIYKIAFYCNTYMDSRIQCFKMFEPREKEDIKNEYMAISSSYNEELRIIEQEKLINSESLETKNESVHPIPLISLICGILALVLSCILIGIVPAVIGMVTGIIGLLDVKKNLTMNIIGIILSAISILIFAIMLYILSQPS